MSDVWTLAGCATELSSWVVMHRAWLCRALQHSTIKASTCFRIPLLPRCRFRYHYRLQWRLGWLSSTLHTISATPNGYLSRFQSACELNVTQWLRLWYLRRRHRVDATSPVAPATFLAREAESAFGCERLWLSGSGDSPDCSEMQLRKWDRSKSESDDSWSFCVGIGRLCSWASFEWAAGLVSRR